MNLDIYKRKEFLDFSKLKIKPLLKLKLALKTKMLRKIYTWDSDYI